MATEDIRNVARDLRQLAREVGSRSDAEAGSLDAERLRHLGELLLIAADMACDIAGDSPGGKELSAVNFPTGRDPLRQSSLTK